MAFPAFTEYQETFSTELRPAMFASFTVPGWVQGHPRLLSIATAVYPHWRERRLEREGRRIIPVLNVRSSVQFRDQSVDTPFSSTSRMLKTNHTSVSDVARLSKPAKLALSKYPSPISCFASRRRWAVPSTWPTTLFSERIRREIWLGTVKVSGTCVPRSLT